MRPDKLAVALRPRSGFEAIDIGIRLAQRCARPLFVANLVLVMSICAIAHLIFGVWLDQPDIGLMIVWWLKPLYDRLALHVLSRGVFDATPSAREALRALPSLVRGSGLFRALTLQRFDSQRALRLPVAQLEGLRGKPARARRKLLSGRVSGSGIALLFCFLHFELLLWWGIPMLISLVIPGDIGFIPPPLVKFYDPFAHPAPWASAVWYLGYGLVVAVLEPFYLAGGFGLYLKRRTDLEAWDVELQLRRLGTPAVIALGAAIAIWATTFAPAPARADDGVARREAAAQKAPAAIKEVLARPEFGHEEKVHRLRWKKNEAEKKADPSKAPSWLKSLFEILAGFGRWLAAAWRVAAWVALGLFAALLIWFLLRQIRLIQAARRPPPPPVEVAGLDSRPESLPDDIEAVAEPLIANGRLREALALLYRGALSRLAHDARIPFERGDTEGDCLLRVTRAGLPARAFFAELTRNWQAVAYARRMLENDEAAALCRAWTSAFGAMP